MGPGRCDDRWGWLVAGTDTTINCTSFLPRVKEERLGRHNGEDASSHGRTNNDRQTRGIASDRENLSLVFHVMIQGNFLRGTQPVSFGMATEKRVMRTYARDSLSCRKGRVAHEFHYSRYLHDVHNRKIRCT